MTFAQSDTDGAFLIATPEGRLVACPGGPEIDEHGRECIRSLTFADVQARRDRFATLARWTDLPISPERLEGRRVIVGEGSPSLFKWEPTALGPDGTLVDCSSYSPGLKKFLQWQEEDPETFKASEATIGPMLNPSPLSKRWFARMCWEFLEAIDAGGSTVPEHDWLDRPTVYPVSVRPEELKRVERAIPDVRPFESLMYVKAFVGAESFLARLDEDPASWAHVEWFTEEGERVRIARAWEERRIGRSDPDGPRVAPVRTWKVFLRSLQRHAVLLTVGPDGRPCGKDTRGLLRPQPVLLVGADVVGRTDWAKNRKAPVFLRDPGRWQRILGVLESMNETELRKAGLAPSTVRALRAGRTPSPRTAALAERVAIRLAEDRVVGDGRMGAPKGQGVLRLIDSRRCEAPGCAHRLVGRQRRWCRVHRAYPGSRRKAWKVSQGEKSAEP